MKKLANISTFENLQNQASLSVTNKTFVEKSRIGQPDRGAYGPISDFNLANGNDFCDLYEILREYSKLVQRGELTKEEALYQIREAYGLNVEQLKRIGDVVTRFRQRRF